VPRHHPRPDRHLASLRPNLRDEPGQPGQDHAHAGLLVLSHRLQGLRVRHRRRDLVRALSDHHRLHPATTMDHAREKVVMTSVTGPGRVGRREPRALATTFVGYAILIFFSLVFIYPFIIQIATSFKTDANATDNPLSPVPDPVSTAGFDRIFSGTDFPTWL